MSSTLSTSGDDIWTLHAQGWYLVDPTNLTLDTRGHNVMGGGISRQVADRYPKVPAIYGGLIARETAGGRARPGSALAPADCSGRVTLVDHEHRLVFLPTKYDWRQPAPISLVDRGLRELAKLLAEQPQLRVALPRIGAGLGGLDWRRDVLPLVEHHLGGFAERLILVDPPSARRPR